MTHIGTVLQLGGRDSDFVRVGVMPDALGRYQAGPQRASLVEAAVRSFRVRAQRAGYPAELIDAEIERFEVQLNGHVFTA